MSLKVKPSNQARSYSASRGFSSSSTGSYPITRISNGTKQAPITPVTINEDLLIPVKIDIDPSAQRARIEEKDQIKSLNNRFLSFIERVRALEQENKRLETKWDLLQRQTSAESSIEPMLKLHIAKLHKQLEILSNDQQRLELENEAMIEQRNESSAKYEQEGNRRYDAENEFAILKKDVDMSYLSKIDLEQIASALSADLVFLRGLYDEEIQELKESVKETSVVVEMDNSRDLVMDPIIAHVKAQYEEIAAQSRKEAERWYKGKFDQMAAAADQYNIELNSARGDVSELTRRIRKLENEISAAKAQSASVKAQVDETELRGVAAAQDAQTRIKELQVALQQAKQAMARQIREYQDLMNLKLALDVEIATYKQLLEGEEQRLGQESVVSIHRVASKAVVQVDSSSQRKSAPLVIKTVETKNTSYS